MKTASLNKLHQLEAEIEKLRQELGVHQKGETLFHAPRSIWSEKEVVVEADGNGGAVLLIVEGNYPADYTIYNEELFKTEEGACEKADQLCTPKRII